MHLAGKVLGHLPHHLWAAVQAGACLSLVRPDSSGQDSKVMWSSFFVILFFPLEWSGSSRSFKFHLLIHEKNFARSHAAEQVFLRVWRNDRKQCFGLLDLLYVLVLCCPGPYFCVLSLPVCFNFSLSFLLYFLSCPFFLFCSFFSIAILLCPLCLSRGCLI